MWNELFTVKKKNIHKNTFVNIAFISAVPNLDQYRPIVKIPKIKHLLDSALCGLVPNDPQTHTGPQTRGWEQQSWTKKKVYKINF